MWPLQSDRRRYRTGRRSARNDTNQFAEVTGGKNPLHVDVDLAAQTPYGTTIVHGLHLLAMAPMLLSSLWQIGGFSSAGELRLEPTALPAALPVGSRVRLRMRIINGEPTPSGARLVVELTFEPEHEDKPVCVSESVFQFFS